MWRNRRALVFDLDDTLYPSRRYVDSAFQAIAAHLSRRCGLNRERTLGVLTRARESDLTTGHEYDRLLAACGLPTAWLPELIAVGRAHEPDLELSRSARRLLETVRPSWSIGVVTNGHPAVQALKVRALGLAAHVDAVVYAAEHGSGQGKPDPEPFLEIARRLDVAPDAVVFVGDDEARDIAGAQAVGMRTIRFTAWTRHRWPADGPSAADGVVRAFAQIPGTADALLGKAEVDAA